MCAGRGNVACVCVNVYTHRHAPSPHHHTSTTPSTNKKQHATGRGAVGVHLRPLRRPPPHQGRRLPPRGRAVRALLVFVHCLLIVMFIYIQTYTFVRMCTRVYLYQSSSSLARVPIPIPCSSKPQQQPPTPTTPPLPSFYARIPHPLLTTSTTTPSQFLRGQRGVGPGLHPRQGRGLPRPQAREPPPLPAGVPQGEGKWP